MVNKIESLNTLIAAIPVFKAAIPADLSIAVCDLEKFIAYYPGKSIDLHIQVGQLCKSRGTFNDCAKRKYSTTR